MSTGQTAKVRVLAHRALQLQAVDDDATVLHRAGDELELPSDEAQHLVEQGFVEKA